MTFYPPADHFVRAVAYILEPVAWFAFAWIILGFVIIGFLRFKMPPPSA